jgi:hypothetical protein
MLAAAGFGDIDGMVDRPEMRASDADRDRIAAALRMPMPMAGWRKTSCSIGLM